MEEIIGFWWVIAFFAIFHISLLVLFFIANSRVVKNISEYVICLAMDLVFELGKALLVGSVIGVVFIPEEKDFSLGLTYGIIFFITGHIHNSRKGI